MKQQNPLGTEEISKLLIKFSIPATVGMVVNALYNIVDRIFIGNAPELGASGLAGITIGFPIMIMLQAIGILLGVGGATLFSMKLGEGKEEEAGRTLGNAFTALLILGILFTISGQIFLTPILQFFGASETVLPYSIEYMKIIFLGSIFQITNMGLNNFLRADGQPKLAMISMFVGAGTNILLDPLFIYTFKMGMTGAALATIIAQGLTTAWILFYFLSKKANHMIKLKYMFPQVKTLSLIFLLGTPNFFLQIGNSLLNIVLNKSLLIYGGDIAISGMGIINSVQTMLLMPIIGINQGVQPIVSFNFGAQKFHRIKEAEKLAIAAATVITVLGWLLTRSFAQEIVSIFNDEPKLVEFGSYALQVWFWCLPTVGFQILGANFFQAIGYSSSAMFLTLTRQILLLIPAILVFSHLWGIKGLLYAGPFADGISALITGVWFYFGIRSLSSNADLGKAKKGILIATLK